MFRRFTIVWRVRGWGAFHYGSMWPNNWTPSWSRPPHPVVFNIALELRTVKGADYAPCRRGCRPELYLLSRSGRAFLLRGRNLGRILGLEVLGRGVGGKTKAPGRPG